MRVFRASNLVDALFFGGRRRRVRLSTLVLLAAAMAAGVLVLNLARRWDHISLILYWYFF